VKVNAPFLEAVNSAIKPLRPPHRLVADLDMAAVCAFVLPDLSIFPSMLNLSVFFYAHEKINSF
jgi:hypothetical protein